MVYVCDIIKMKFGVSLNIIYGIIKMRDGIFMNAVYMIFF